MDDLCVPETSTEDWTSWRQAHGDTSTPKAMWHFQDVSISWHILACSCALAWAGVRFCLIRRDEFACVLPSFVDEGKAGA